MQHAHARMLYEAIINMYAGQRLLLHILTNTPGHMTPSTSLLRFHRLSTQSCKSVMQKQTHEQQKGKQKHAIVQASKRA
jgi:hypothetical protein